MGDIKTHADRKTRTMWHIWLSPAVLILGLLAYLLLHITDAPVIDRGTISATMSALFLILLLLSPLLFLIFFGVIILIDERRIKRGHKP